jgi:hypothetical protein
MAQAARQQDLLGFNRLVLPLGKSSPGKKNTRMSHPGASFNF